MLRNVTRGEGVKNCPKKRYVIDIIEKKDFYIPNCQELDHSVEFHLRTTVSAILKKVRAHVFLSKFMEFFTILYENTWTSPQLTFLTNSIGIICTVTCISHVPGKKWRVIFTPPTNKTIFETSLRRLQKITYRSLSLRFTNYRVGEPQNADLSDCGRYVVHSLSGSSIGCWTKIQDQKGVHLNVGCLQLSGAGLEGLARLADLSTLPLITISFHPRLGDGTQSTWLHDVLDALLD